MTGIQWVVEILLPSTRLIEKNSCYRAICVRQRICTDPVSFAPRFFPAGRRDKREVDIVLQVDNNLQMTTQSFNSTSVLRPTAGLIIVSLDARAPPCLQNSFLLISLDKQVSAVINIHSCLAGLHFTGVENKVATVELVPRAQEVLRIVRIQSEQGKNRPVCLLIINHQKTPPISHSVKKGNVFLDRR